MNFVQARADDASQSAGTSSQPVLEVDRLSLRVGGHPLLNEVSFAAPDGAITAIIGRSGSGKSSLLRVINRMWEGTPKAQITGSVRFAGQNVYAPGIEVSTVRTKIGMVFQRPTPFPRSIYDNLALTLKVHGMRKNLDVRIESLLRAAGLWEEVKDRLHQSALTLSGGQQQRLCIARALAVSPRLLLMDEPQSALDPQSREQITQLMLELKTTTSIVLVTHHLEEAKRVSDWAGVMASGKLIAFGRSREIFDEAIVQDWN